MRQNYIRNYHGNRPLKCLLRSLVEICVELIAVSQLMQFENHTFSFLYNVLDYILVKNYVIVHEDEAFFFIGTIVI